MKEEDRPQKWIVAEEDDYVHVVPDWDMRPHASVLTPIMEKFELSGEDCDCKPEVRLHDKKGEFIKPMIVHNSFLQQKKVNESLKKIKI